MAKPIQSQFENNVSGTNYWESYFTFIHKRQLTKDEYDKIVECIYNELVKKDII